MPTYDSKLEALPLVGADDELLRYCELAIAHKSPHRLREAARELEERLARRGERLTQETCLAELADTTVLKKFIESLGRAGCIRLSDVEGKRADRLVEVAQTGPIGWILFNQRIIRELPVR